MFFNAILLVAGVVAAAAIPEECASGCEDENDAHALLALRAVPVRKTMTRRERRCTGKPPPLLKCDAAEVQSPRDLRTVRGHLAPGEGSARILPLSQEQKMFLPIGNVHFHLGAEHPFDGCGDNSESLKWDTGDRDPTGHRPGWMCDTSSLSKRQLKPYTFEHCKHVEVGKTYEIHRVHTTVTSHTKEKELERRLFKASHRVSALNPTIVVDAVVIVITKKGPDELDVLAWSEGKYVSKNTSVMYVGSTTGSGYNNTVCSSYAATWHVDTRRYAVTAESFDRFCHSSETLEEPHGSRMLVDSAYVANAGQVRALA